MAHMLETWADGSASFVSARQHAWHRLGEVLPAEFDAAAAMAHAKLAGWNVRKQPLTTTPIITADGVTTLDVPEQFATIRTNPVTGRPDVLGVVGSGYTPIQNEEHVDLLDALVDESGAHFETAGSLRGGRGVFITMKMPTTMQIGGIDPVDLYLVALNSHDGTSAFRLLVSPVRVVCANTQAAALRTARASFSIRHTSGARGQIAQAREALGLTFTYAEAFEAEAQTMIAQQITDEQFRELVAQLWTGEEKSERAKTIATKRRREVTHLWRHSPTMTEIRGTKWAAYQAVTEYTDHVAPVSDKRDQAGARAARTVSSATIAQLKTRAFELITAM
jgi:phage/plasmid-like protein (TIGR03299 family)